MTLVSMRSAQPIKSCEKGTVQGNGSVPGYMGIFREMHAK
jgi:hypothetical protein